MPSFSTVSHISFSVRDADATALWWQELFGLRPEITIDDDGWRAVILELTDTIAIEFQQHDGNLGERFDPTRTGFDHMGLKVETRAELDEWRAHFEQHGVVHTPTVDREYGGEVMSVLTFKDPDGIQFEMFHWVNHP